MLVHGRLPEEAFQPLSQLMEEYKNITISELKFKELMNLMKMILC